jgi:hypothetical protein
MPTLLLYGNSDELRRYYMNAWTNPNSKVRPPRRLLTPWWKAILQKVESNQDKRRWQLGAALLDVDFQSQEAFEKSFTSIVEGVRNNGNDSGPNSFVNIRQMCGYNTAVAALAYKQLSYEERNARLSELAATAHADGAKEIVLIGRDVERMRDPYDVLGFVDGAVLQQAD